MRGVYSVLQMDPVAGFRLLLMRSRIFWHVRFRIDCVSFMLSSWPFSASRVAFLRFSTSTIVQLIYLWPPCAMTSLRTSLQLRVLKRLEFGLPPSRWQQFMLHLLALSLQLRRKHFHNIWFYCKGMLRVFWKPFTVIRLAGVPVQLHATWLIFPAGFLIWLLFDYNRPWNFYCALLLLFSLCVSELTHEYAHVLTARKFGIGSRRIILIPLGALAELESELVLPNEFWIALAGPVASFALAGIFWEG